MSATVAAIPSSPSWHRRQRSKRSQARRRLKLRRALHLRPVASDLSFLTSHHTRPQLRELSHMGKQANWKSWPQSDSAGGWWESSGWQPKPPKEQDTTKSLKNLRYDQMKAVHAQASASTAGLSVVQLMQRAVNTSRRANGRVKRAEPQGCGASTGEHAHAGRDQRGDGSVGRVCQGRPASRCPSCRFPEEGDAGCQGGAPTTGRPQRGAYWAACRPSWRQQWCGALWHWCGTLSAWPLHACQGQAYGKQKHATGKAGDDSRPLHDQKPGAMLAAPQAIPNSHSGHAEAPIPTMLINDDDTDTEDGLDDGLGYME